MNWVCSLGKCGWGDVASSLEIKGRLSCEKEAILCLGISRGQN